MLPDRMGFADQHHHGGNGAGAGEHGHAQRDDAGVGFFCAFLLFFRGGFLRGLLALQHVEADLKKDDAAGNFESRQSDAKHFENQAAGDGEGGEDDGASQRRFAGDGVALGFFGAGGDREEQRDYREGINQEEYGGRGQQRELQNGFNGRLHRSLI